MARKKFNPEDPFPPYPPPDEPLRDPTEYPSDRWAREMAKDAHPDCYPAEQDQRDAYESGYLQGCEDLTTFVLRE